MPEKPSDEELLGWTSEIVAAHVNNNKVSPTELSDLIRVVHSTLIGLAQGPAETRPEPAVSPRRSVTPDYIVCLEDGKKLKMLKRHLKTAYDMTPEEYRERWGLPPDYPMVAPNYAKQRSSLAKKIGLGRRPTRRSEGA